MNKKHLQKLVESLNEDGVFKVLIEEEYPTTVCKKHKKPIIENVNGNLEIVGYKEFPYYERAIESITIVDAFANYNDDIDNEI